MRRSFAAPLPLFIRWSPTGNPLPVGYQRQKSEGRGVKPARMSGRPARTHGNGPTLTLVPINLPSVRHLPVPIDG